ncbi:hypothetical protein ACFXB3_12370 [Streptomyces sp. NPDC059447]|uniref:hypothetical protein n=1 Tax=Streptomyces sp. NPDC059447 TaxID=3346834 RepID=UPI0036922E55
MAKSFVLCCLLIEIHRPHPRLYDNARMGESATDLGCVTAPSGVLVLGMAGWVDFWQETDQPLSVRAADTSRVGGVHIRDGLAEAVAVHSAADRPLAVRAIAQPSPFDGGPTIGVLEVGLGLPWGGGPEVPVGDLPVDRCGMVLGDARALDSFTGLSGSARNGLADVAYWGLHAEAACAEFGGTPVGRAYEGGPRGWQDLPLARAKGLADQLGVWIDSHAQGRGLMVAVDEHTDYHLARRAGQEHELLAGIVEVAGCPVIGIDWDPGDHSMRHRGERAFGQVYPVTLGSDSAGQAVLRWTISAVPG